MQCLGRCGTMRTPRNIATFLRVAVLAVLVTLAAGLQSSSAFAAAKFAAMTVDARNGKVLFAENAAATRHPASLTNRDPRPRRQVCQ